MIGNLKRNAYTKKVVEHSKNPRNRGVIDSPSAIGKAGGPCGDETEFYIKIGKKKFKGVEVEYIEDIKFETMGCAAAVATASMVTDMIKGKPLTEAFKITREKVLKNLGGLPLVKIHCCDLTIDAIKKTLENWQKKKKRK